MTERNAEEMKDRSGLVTDTNISIGKIKAASQITTKATGWSEDEKERMRTHCYDSLDMVRAWYS